MSLRLKQTNQQFIRIRPSAPSISGSRSGLNLAVWGAFIRQDGTTISTNNPGVWKQGGDK